MEFFLYLTPIGKQIVSNIMLKGYTIRENAPICRNKEVFGMLKSPYFDVCLNNIKNTISPVKHYVNETIYHEAVHVVQSCKKGTIGIKNIQLDDYKMKDVFRSTKVANSYQIYEMEAYYLEDKPKEVDYYLKKYCF